MNLRLSIPVGLITLQLLVPGVNALAETNEPPDRYLLVVDTSSPMRAREEALQASVSSLLGSGMRGEIHNGDELGIWTFNTDLYTGDFDLVIWDETARERIRNEVLMFLDKQRFRKSTDFARVMPDLMEVVADSKRITVILLSDGDEVITGTPFDEAIADYFRENTGRLKEQRVPVLTVLRGYEGELVGHTLSYPPWPVEFPEFPPEPEPELEAPAEPEAGDSAPTHRDLSRTLLTTNKGPIVFAEPLIVSGPSRKPGQPVVPVATNELTTNSAATSDVLGGATGGDSTPSADSAGDEALPGEKAKNSSRLRSRALLVGVGGILLLVVLVVGLMLMRRPRPKRRVSLITRSMEKKDGPE